MCKVVLTSHINFLLNTHVLLMGKVVMHATNYFYLVPVLLEMGRVSASAVRLLFPHKL